ncbi:SCO family protein [Rickettsia canadensis]|uniref:Sco2 protein n=1 Tax=Rickettsia canadensis str. CA410 TaxID=1105107 RepID=A0ABM5MSA3_RICCA|nr:SCO family protein [Rickettsia canadensis]AFB20937.1 Sco2 protein precursor [Rickettsia canadensis str. CA410]
MKMQSNVIKIIIIISLLIGVGALYLLLSLRTPTKPLAGQVNIYEDNVKIGGDFKLIDQNGEIFNSDELKGNLSLIYFGFTRCPDICPTSLNKMTEIVEMLNKHNIDIIPIFITIDSKRDTPIVLKEYLKHFHPKFIGLTGNEQQIKDITNKFKVFYARVNNDDDDPNYMFDHSSFIYLMDTNGKYLKHFYLDSSPKEIIEFLRNE